MEIVSVQNTENLQLDVFFITSFRFIALTSKSFTRPPAPEHLNQPSVVLVLLWREVMVAWT